MANAQVTLSLPVLRKGSEPETGPTAVKHLQLMLNQRGGFPILVEDGDFGATTEDSVKHYQQNENLTVTGSLGDRHGLPSYPSGSCNRNQADVALAITSTSDSDRGHSQWIRRTARVCRFNWADRASPK
jgi:peptidoglycan hydrolase-like protein with peptidoglycan-binding domain